MSGVVVGDDGLARCPWGAADEEMRAYHDTEWGVPVTGESAYFERLTLEAFQSGLSWRTILRKRPAFRAAFDGFDIDRISEYDERDRARLLADAGIVRNYAKIDATMVNAAAAVRLRDVGGLEAVVERHRPDPPLPAPRDTDDVPPLSSDSVALSQTLKKAGFVFVGPTTMYALMQALGVVDDHLAGCHRRGSGR